MKLKFILLLGFLAVVGLGIAAVTVLLWIGTTDRVLVPTVFTVISFAGYGLATFLAALVRDRGHMRPAMAAVYALGAAGFALSVYMAWAEIFSRYDSDFRGIFFLIWLASAFAVAFVTIGLLQLVRLKRGLHWLRKTTTVMIWLLTASTSLMVYDEFLARRHYYSDTNLSAEASIIFGMFSVLGIAAVLVAQRFQGEQTEQDIDFTPMPIHAVCPRCALEQTLTIGQSRCRRCRLKFKIEVQT